MAQLGRPAPEWQIAEWVNGEPDLTNKVVVALAFQMLCPGCATQALPQMQRVRAAFGEADVAVVGLHTVFEHHEAMTPTLLLIDRRGVLRRQTFGHVPDLQLGAEIMALALEGGSGG